MVIQILHGRDIRRHGSLQNCNLTRLLCHVQALLTHNQADFDYQRIVQVLVRALKDDHSRVVTVAIEALAVVHHLIGDEIQPMLIASGASVSSRLMLAGRFASKDLPAVKADGAVEHEVSPFGLQHSRQTRCISLHYVCCCIATLHNAHDCTKSKVG